MSEIVTVRWDDPHRVELEAEGWRVVGESRGARLQIGQPPQLELIARLRSLVVRAAGVGVLIRELDASEAPALVALERATADDYPSTPAARHAALDLEAARSLWSEGKRIFGAFAGDELVGATVIGRSPGQPDAAETEFTSVLGSERGKGIGSGIKAASVLALVDEGVRSFGTGGAVLDEASLAANRSLGYEVDERWVSLERS